MTKVYNDHLYMGLLGLFRTIFKTLASDCIIVIIRKSNFVETLVIKIWLKGKLYFSL